MMDSNTTTTHAITMQGRGQPHRHHHGDRHPHRHGDGYGYGYRSGRRGWVVSGVVVFLSVMLVLSGCTSPGDDPSPGVTSPAGTAGETTLPTTTTTTAVPPPTTAAVYKPASDTGPAENVPKPVLPAKAQEFSKEGLIAFTEYWYSTLGYAFETGDPEPMMTITDSSCDTCAQVNDSLEEWYLDGGWAVGGQMTVVQSTTTFKPTQAGTYQALLLVRQNQVSYYKSDGTLSSSHPQGIAETNIVVATFNDDRWQAQTAEPLKKGS